MSLVIHGIRIPIPGVKVVSWLDDPRLNLMGIGGKPSTQPKTGIILHTESGDDPHVLVDGLAPDYDHGAQLAASDRGDAATGHAHGQHLDVATDGVVYQYLDLADAVAWHAADGTHSANATTIGVELHDPWQPARATIGAPPRAHQLFTGQLDALVLVLDVITRELGIPRSYHAPYRAPVDRLRDGRAYGLWGHRDQTDQRGPGDPGDLPWQALQAAGYVPLDYAKGEDLADVQRVQRDLVARGANVAVDGVPGPATRAAIRRYADQPEQQRTGLMVVRPGD